MFPAIIGESVPSSSRGHAFGVFELVVGAAAAIGPLAGAALLPFVGSRGLLLATGGVFVAAAAARQFLLRETRPAAAERGGLALVELFQGRLGVVLLILVCQTAIVGLGLYGPFLTLHARDVMSLSKSEIDVLYALAYILAACASPSAGKAVARWGADRVLAWAGLAMGASLLFWTAQTRPVLIVAWMLASAGCFQFLVVAGDAFRAAALPDSIRGRALGAIGAVSGVVSAVAVFLAGHWRLGAPVAPFLLLAATALVAFVGVQVLAARERPARAAAPSA